MKTPDARFVACVGNSTYELEDSATPGMVTVIRSNGDGTAMFHFPAELIIDYAMARLIGQLKKLVGGRV